jgi:hypothetical protein
MGAVADITGIDQPPRYFAITTEGLTRVRDTQAALMAPTQPSSPSLNFATSGHEYLSKPAAPTSVSNRPDAS